MKDDNDVVLPIPDFLDNFGDTTQAVGIGLLSLILIGAISMLGMWAGYALGRKNKTDEDTDFMRAILDEAKLYRRKH
jgi:hypothetical protein